ncbi:MAG: hypothetical protein HZB77_06120 [Chloroflexi bacterium]|nr:hypothetical protein [Chloroflexota bacterium]
MTTMIIAIGSNTDSGGDAASHPVTYPYVCLRLAFSRPHLGESPACKH